MRVAKKGADTVWMTYHSAYGGETLRADAKTALARLQRTLDRFAPGTTPAEVELQVEDAQTEALYQATRTGGGGARAADPAAAWAAAGGVQHPVAVALAQALGPGQRAVFAEGASGDLWHTTWRVRDADQISALWPKLLEALWAHLDTPPIHACWGHGARGEAPSSPIRLVVRWDCALRRLDGVDPFTGPKDRNRRLCEGTRIFAFLGASSSAIFDITAPFDALDADFAAWERALNEALGVSLHDGHWRRTFIHPEGSSTSSHWVPGRYRRKDWIDGDGALSHTPQGPWTALIDELLAPRVSVSRAYDLRALLLAQPLGPAAAALVRAMGPLKGAALDRGHDALRDMVKQADDRSVCLPVVEALFADPPNIAVSRKVGHAFAPAFSEPWLIGLILEELDKKKPSGAVLPFAEEAVGLDFDPAAARARAWALGQLLRRLRAKGAQTYRVVFAGALTRCDDGSGWPTLLLEAASPPPKAEDLGYTTWAHTVLTMWYGPDRGRARVTDPALGAYIDRLPPEGFDFVRPPAPARFALTDAERAELLAREASWLGER